MGYIMISDRCGHWGSEPRRRSGHRQIGGVAQDAGRLDIRGIPPAGSVTSQNCGAAIAGIGRAHRSGAFGRKCSTSGGAKGPLGGGWSDFGSHLF